MKTYACDFETTVYDGQTETEVWASGLCELYTEDFKLFHSIEETFDFLTSHNEKVVCYYHNLKFDGAFWLDYLYMRKGFEQAFELDEVTGEVTGFVKDNYMCNNTFKYLITEMGQHYTITFKTNGNIIELRDSLKLIPLSISDMGKAFETKHRKTEIEYKGNRYAGCYISEQEKEYLANDVYVLKEALEYMFDTGNKKLTISACSLSEYKKLCFFGDIDFRQRFPDLTEINLPCEMTADEYIRKSYKGGWCYVVPEKSGKIITHGLTVDVNSLYPSVMHSESGNYYPVGKPKYYKGKPADTFLRAYHMGTRYAFIRFKCRFKINKGYLPFIQIKNSYWYQSNECLTTSDIHYNNDRYCNYYGMDRQIHDAKVELVLTITDYILFIEHYNVYDIEYIDYLVFGTEKGVFDEYINKHRKIKEKSKGAKRTLSKLRLNTLYGKFGVNPRSNFKVIRKHFTDDTYAFDYVSQSERKPLYVAVASAVTSYAREFTIRTAQKNYHGPNKRGFIYADTDSIHCDLSPDELIDVPIDDTAFNHWKIESQWKEAIFVRQKTYIEHITHSDGLELDDTRYMIKGCGMSERCKKLMEISLNCGTQEQGNMTDEEFEFASIWRTLDDYKPGLTIPGNLKLKHIKGGVILVDSYFTIN